LRKNLGPKALVRTKDVYSLKTDAIEGRSQTSPKFTISNTDLKGLREGSAVSGNALPRLLYGAGVEAQRTILYGRDPLGDLLKDYGKLVRALERRSYWIVATSGEDVAVSLAELARHAQARASRKAVRERLRIILVNEEARHLSFVLEVRQLQFVVARNCETAFVEAQGETVIRDTVRRLGRYGAQNRGPVVREAKASEGAEIKMAKFLERFRTACTLPDDIIDDIVEDWFSSPEPRPAGGESKSAVGIGDLAKTSD